MTADTVKTFGKGADHSGTVPFRVEVHHRPTGATWEEQFEAWVDPGPTPVLHYIRAAASGQEGAEMSAASALLVRALVDTDGTSYAEVRAGVLAGQADDTADGDVERPEPWNEPAPPASWSSAARFNLIADSLDHHIAADAIVEIAAWLARQAFGGAARPTRRPSA